MSLAHDQDLPPFKELKQKPPKISVEKHDDGSLIVSSDYDIGELDRSVPHSANASMAVTGRPSPTARQTGRRMPWPARC